jgi:hypothetical protein
LAYPAMRQPMRILRSTLGEYALHPKRNVDIGMCAIW